MNASGWCFTIERANTSAWCCWIQHTIGWLTRINRSTVGLVSRQSSLICFESFSGNQTANCMGFFACFPTSMSSIFKTTRLRLRNLGGETRKRQDKQGSTDGHPSFCRFLLSEITISELTRFVKGMFRLVTLQWPGRFLCCMQLSLALPLRGLQWPGKQMMLNTDMCLVWSNDADGKVDMKRGCIFDWNHKTLKTLKPQTGNIWEHLNNISL